MLPRVWSLHDGPFSRVLADAGIPVSVMHARGYRKPLSAMSSLLDACREASPDILHSWGWVSTVLCSIASRRLGIPHVNGSVRSGSVPAGHRLRARLTALLGDVVVSNSRAGLESTGLLSSPRAVVIRNAFDEERLRLPPEHPRSGGCFEAVMTGVLRHDKDFESFLEACRILVERRRRVRFSVVGGGEDLEKLETAYAQLLETGSARFTGYLTEVVPVLLSSDAGVLLSRRGEGTSNSLIEYMACSLPVVCTDCPGNREVVEDGVDAILVPEGDPVSVASAVEELMDNPLEASAMGSAGRSRMSSAFTVGAMTEAYADLYGMLLDRRETRRRRS